MLTFHQGSILDADVDYIVNPANSFLRHGGGLAKVIDEAATAEFSGEPVNNAWVEHNIAVHTWRVEHLSAPLIATGNALITSAGALPYKGVIHAVGPIWNGGAFCENDLLELALESSFDLLPEGASIALPAISSGVFGMPINTVARISVAVARWYEDEHDIQFWLFSDEHRDAFMNQAANPVFG